MKKQLQVLRKYADPNCFYLIILFLLYWKKTAPFIYFFKIQIYWKKQLRI